MPVCSPLMVTDLFYNILDCFHPTIDPLGRQALAALAQTCRAFSEPSLDRLWRKLRSLEPLIRCYTSLNQVKNAIPPTSSQFSVIDRYSRRILDITIWSNSASVRFLQCTSMRPSCLLPNLKVLEYSPSIHRSCIPIIYIQRLLSPTLVSLAVTLAETDQATLLSFFDNYPLSCRNLKSVEFGFLALSKSPQPSGTTIQALSQAICNQENLEKVVIHAPIDRIALSYLCTLRTLKVLYVRLSEISILPTGTFLPTDPLFCNVEEIQFDTSNLDLVASLLRPRDQSFHTFHLFCYGGRVTSNALLDVLNLLTSRSRQNSLRELILSIGDFSNPMPADQMTSEAIHYRLSYKTLEPLMVFRSLRTLEIDWSEQISLDDDELGNMARSWPLLRVLNFSCIRGGHPPFSTKHPTLLGLLSLVDSCPALVTVSLPLDAREVPVVMDTKARKTSLRFLTVLESPINEARPVAEFLFKYFPSVIMLVAKFLKPPGTNVQQITAYEQAWRQAETHLQGFPRSSSDDFRIADISDA